MKAIDFSYTGGVQDWTVPSGVSAITVECWGAAGGADTNAGLGGYAKATAPVKAGETLSVYVGGHLGWPNGGHGPSAGDNGGGSSDVRRGTSLNNRFVVAGGGGGTGEGPNNNPGGSGGGLEGTRPNVSGSGFGGTQTAGGAGGAGETSFYDGKAGDFGVGGDGGGSSTVVGGGGGGGGWYGGGGGGGGPDTDTNGSGGGGGSGYVAASGNTSTSMSVGVRAGDGLVRFTYNTAPSAPGAFTSPTSGEVVDTTDTVAHGGSTDPDGDTLTYDFDLSLDNGSTWSAIRTRAAGTSFTHDYTTTKPTNVAKWRSRAWDGAVYGGYTTSPTFTIQHLPYTPRIML
jgi:hypothetical protein